MAVAQGIPKKEYGDPLTLQAGELVKLFAQQHQADRAGLHTDFRLGNNQGGLYSWAFRKGIPEPGKKHGGKQTYLHEESYGPFSGTIPEGYGKGTVTSTLKGKALITSVDRDGLTFVTAHERNPQRFRLQQTNADDLSWLLINVTPTAPVEEPKVHYTRIPVEDVEKLFTPENIIQAKVDGSAAFVKVLGDKLESISYRPQKATGYPIVHSERAGLWKYRNRNFPKDTTLRGELFAEGPEGPLSAAETGGFLNATVEHSLQKQKDRGVTLKHMLFDIPIYKGKSTADMPYEERYALLQKLGPLLPETFFVAEGIRDPEKQKKLWDKVISGVHRLTKEGIVAHPAAGGKPIKVKTGLPEQDVIIRKVYRGEGKYRNSAGGFWYALPDNPDKIVGKVGGGFSDADRQDMWDNPDQWLDRTARISAQEQFRSGAYRSPEFIARHEG